MSQTKDEVLVKQILAGDKGAFAELVALYQRRITALGMGFFKNISDTEDFVQDVFAKLYSKLSLFRGDSLFSTWFTRIAYNVAINSVNRRKEYVSIVDEATLCARECGPEEEQERIQVAEAVRKTFRELPDEYRECVDLYFFHDMPYKEIVNVTDLPLNTVKSRIFRAKKLLRDKLIAKEVV